MAGSDRRFLQGFQQGASGCGKGSGGCAPEGSRGGNRRGLRAVRPENGHQNRPVRQVPGLPGLPGVPEHQAPGGEDARPVSQVRRCHPQAQVQEGLRLLRLREGGGVRLHDLGRAHGGGLPGVRSDPLQKVRQGQNEALLHQREVLQVPAGRPAGLL